MNLSKRINVEKAGNYAEVFAWIFLAPFFLCLILMLLALIVYGQASI
jgi:hypothetical protein